ncbi:6057_t:CDS:10 [Paraglomus occultum]|uniref:6057_t:CDS:1 n=1 Tax=Paraglomus occultum TaxID=144539 RepID=A0A9N8VWU5_9GLOM|nr:6057_t:CDS:10 [Paraglomus occultum]
MPAPDTKIQLKTSFKLSKTIDVLYTGGKVCMTSDEKYIITTVVDTIIVTDINTGTRIASLEGDTEPITTFTTTPNDKYLIASSRSLTVRIWDLQAARILRSFKAHDAPILMMANDTTSTLVATGSADSTVRVWDIDGGYCTHNFRGHGGVITALKFHPDIKRLLLFSGADDCKIRVWDLKSRNCLAVFESHVSLIRGLDVSNDGNLLISGSRDKVVNVWDIENKKLINTFPIYETIETVGILKPETTFGVEDDHEHNELFYTGGDKGIVRIWDLNSGKLVKSQEPEKNTNHVVSDIIYCTLSNNLAVITSDQNILIYNINLNLKRTKQIIGYNDEIIDIAYIGRANDHLAIATNTEQIRIYHINTLDCDVIYGHSDIVICLDRSTDGTLLLSGSKDRTARLWTVDFEAEETIKCVGICSGHAEAIGAVALSKKDASFCITGSRDRTVKYWDLQKLDRLSSTDSFRPKAFYTHLAHDKDINSIAIAPNDKIFATASQDKTVKVWSVADGTLIGTCNGHKRGVWSVQFSSVDQCLLTSSGDKTIKIWSLSDFSCLKTFEGHTNTVLKASFLTSGTQIVSAGSDGLVKLWTIKTNECATTLDNHTDKIWTLVVSKDEKTVITAGADSLINFWEDCTAEEMEARVREEEELILKEQDLANFLAVKDYKNAILLAMNLGQPFRLLNLFSNIINEKVEDDTSITGSQAIDDIIASLEINDVEKLLTYIRDWNTNAKRSRTAQTILHAILRFFSSERLQEINGIKGLLDGLIPYSERHYQRVDRMMTDSFIVDYTLHAMDLWSTGDEFDVEMKEE